MVKLLRTIIVLTLVSGSLSLNLNGILGIQQAPLRNVEEPEVVEIIRWRQPVCVTPAKGVLPCLSGLSEIQSNYKKISESDDKPVNEIKDRSAESSEDEDSGASVETKLLSPKVVNSVSIDELEPSSLEDSNEQSQERILSLKSSIAEKENVDSDNSRQGKYLVLSGRGRNVASKPPPIYVTKIRDSPVVATLVAYNCLPDIGIPLCDDAITYPKPFQDPLIYQYPTKPTNPSYVSNEPVNEAVDTSSEAVPCNNEPEEPINFWEDPNSPYYGIGEPNESSSKPPAIQAIHDYINRPDVVSANEEPEVKPVLVVEPTPKPGLFGGLWRPGFWDKSTTTAKPNVVVIQHQNPPVYVVEDKPSKPTLVEVAEKPSLDEILHKPENDISNRPGLLDIFSKPITEKPVVIAKPTEKPGIFGGLWPNPTKPENPDKPLTSVPSIFDGFPNLFTRPTSKPLIIDRPDEKPLLVEKPVYVVEKPVLPTLTNIFRPEGTTALDNQDHEVIKDPVYVYQKPAQHPGIFSGVFGGSYSTTPTTAKPGIFDGWNIFNNNKPNNNKPIIVIDEQSDPVIIQKPEKPVVVVEQPEEPIVVEEKPQKPTVVVQKPLLPTKPILVEDVPAKPVVIEEEPIVVNIPEKPKPVVVVQHPIEPIVIVQKPSKPQIPVIIENNPELPSFPSRPGAVYPIGGSISSASATGVSVNTGTGTDTFATSGGFSTSDLSTGSTQSAAATSGSGATAVAGANFGSSEAGSSASSINTGSYTGSASESHANAESSTTNTGSHTAAGSHAVTGSYTGTGSYIGTGTATHANAGASSINTGSYAGSASGSHTGAESSTTNTGSHTAAGSHAGTGSYTGTGSYIGTGTASHADAGASSINTGSYTGSATHADVDASSINTGSYTGSASHADADASSINTGSYTGSASHADADASSINTGSYTGSASHADAEPSSINTGSYTGSASGSHASAESSTTNTGSHTAAGSHAGTGSYTGTASYIGTGTASHASAGAIGSSIGTNTDTITFTNGETVLPTLKGDFNGETEDTKENTFKTKAEDIENEA